MYVQLYTYVQLLLYACTAAVNKVNFPIVR